MRRRLLVVLALGGVLLVPSSFGAATTSNLSGTVTQVPGGYKVTIKNEGPDTAKYVWIRGVKHTSCSANRGGGCAPGGDAFTVRAFWADFFAGETREVTIMTDVPLAANAGVGLFTSDLINGPLVPAGKATGPPPAALTEPCKCTALTAKVLRSSLRIRESVMAEFGNEEVMRLSFLLPWTIRCSEGKGSCRGELKLVVKKIRSYSLLFGLIPTLDIDCKGPCRKLSTGNQKVTLLGIGLGALERKEIGSIPIVIQRKCAGKNLVPITVSIAFKANGNIDLKKSKLG